MAICGQCGRESPEDFGFCPGCGAPLAGTPAGREVRKVVTVLFCDLTGSTEIGDRTDPEALRALMRRYYETARVVLERHGGTVEKFVGDAVMAVFGIPVATEDDALRAVRAAVELRDTVHELGLEARIGVNTGDVVAGEGDTLVTGDAVNVAARLEQAAGAGEVLLGDETLGLVRDAVTSEPVSLTLKGKPEPITAHRLVALDPAAAGLTRRLDRPMVGRQRERDRLRADFEDAVASRSSRLFTLIGPAGVGKSRLVADFLEGVADAARVARGRALSYGEGITYWPLVEMLIQLGIEPAEAIRSSPADTQLATRALFEAVAEAQPLVLVLDDLQWAEPPMFDLVEHIVDWSRDAPIFVLCIGRPELLDVRPGWGGGKTNATSIVLEPLGEAESAELAGTLLGDLELDAETRARMLAIAEGNPLFLEEMAALAREADGTVSVPPTIRALLQARLDTLSDAERTVVERGAVEGKVFHRGAVTALSPAPQRETIAGQLLGLVRKEIVRPDRTQFAGDDAFRFRHLLIRDTAYDSLPKAVRAELHEQFAGWLDTHGDLVEQDELVGYHLEQAARYRLELDETDAAALRNATAAAARLARAGHAAFARGDLNATSNLLGRAHALFRAGPERRAVLPELIAALDRLARAAEAEVLVRELELGSEVDRAAAAVARIDLDPLASGSMSVLMARLDEAERVFREANDRLGLARVERGRAVLAWVACRGDLSHAAYRRAWDEFEAIGYTALQDELFEMIIASGAFAGNSVDQQRELHEQLVARMRRDAGPLLRAAAELTAVRIAFLGGQAGYADVESASLRHATLQRQTGSEVGYWTAFGFLAFAADLEGRLDETERLCRLRAEGLGAIGDRRVLANVLGDWAVTLARLGDAQQALVRVAQAREIVREEDLADRIVIELGEGMARAVLGDGSAARAAVVEARRIAAGIVMWPVTSQLDRVDGLIRLREGDAAGARDIGAVLVADAESRGMPRIADAYRRQLIEPAERMLAAQ
ncbi:MAG TPA: adenylate/guanylate cyclase domain-containing protein [Candidatus Limnocylindria bacterium]|nr:adenylate/guanylate cyclase domain-containing protein [Candidatus Limnocylindria bacterium]